jgi:magnesium transporter
VPSAPERARAESKDDVATTHAREATSSRPPKAAAPRTSRPTVRGSKTVSGSKKATVAVPTHEAWLFDADRKDRSVELSADTIRGLKPRQLLWIDVSADPAKDPLDALIGLLPVDVDTALGFHTSSRTPQLTLSGTYFQLRLMAMTTADGRDRPTTLDMIAGADFVVTIHADPLESFEDLAKRLGRDTSVGRLDSSAFAAVLLDGFITSYLTLADDLEATVDRLDEAALKTDASRDLLGEMVALRHRIAAARRALTAHREVISALARPDFEAIAGTSSGSYFQTLVARFDHAVDAVDGSRESLVGTFDIHMTRTSQRTNDIMKTLTIVSVTLLPAGVISGFMGMNETPPFAVDDWRVFWIVVIVIAVVAAFTLIALRLRRWI